VCGEIKPYDLAKKSPRSLGRGGKLTDYQSVAMFQPSEIFLAQSKIVGTTHREVCDENIAATHQRPEVARSRDVMLAPLREMGLVAARRWFVVEQSVKLFANRLGDENDRRVEVNLLGGDSFEKLAVPELPTPHDIGNNYIVADGEHARFGENTDCATKCNGPQMLDHSHGKNPFLT
jgi:hypothetical protein